MRRVKLIGTVSQVPYFAVDADTDEPVGYCDDSEDFDGVAVITRDVRMFTLKDPILVKVVSRTEVDDED